MGARNTLSGGINNAGSRACRPCLAASTAFFPFLAPCVQTHALTTPTHAPPNFPFLDFHRPSFQTSLYFSFVFLSHHCYFLIVDFFCANPGIIVDKSWSHRLVIFFLHPFFDTRAPSLRALAPNSSLGKFQQSRIVPHLSISGPSRLTSTCHRCCMHRVGLFSATPTHPCFTSDNQNRPGPVC